MFTICFFVAGVYSHFPIDCFVLFCLLPEVIPYNCLSIERLIVWIIDCVCETWDVHKIFNVFESQIWKGWFTSDRIGSYGCQEKYLAYSAVENHSWTTKETKELFSYELFNIKTKTEVIFKFLLYIS